MVLSLKRISVVLEVNARWRMEVKGLFSSRQLGLICHLAIKNDNVFVSDFFIWVSERTVGVDAAIY